MNSKAIVDKLMLAEYAAETMVYFERHQLIPIITRLVAEVALIKPQDPQKWMGENIQEIGRKIYENCLNVSNEGGTANFYETPGRFCYRVVVHGRPGSGRRTMAMYIAKRFKVIYLDVSILVCNLNDQDPMCLTLEKAVYGEDVRAKGECLRQIIEKRLLSQDCLRYGWVMINFPTNLHECKILFEKFKIPPNKLVYLQCPEIMGKRRLLAKPLLHPRQKVDCIEANMNYFKRHEEQVYDYLLHRHETIFIDSTPCAEPVRNAIFSKLERTPYVMGFK